MAKDELNFIQKLKPYHIILLACILCPLLIIHSKNVNEKRAKENLYKQKKNIFEKIISKRKLQEDESDTTEELTDIDKVCKRGSAELGEYYDTGDLTKIGLKDSEGIKCEEKEKDYFKALIRVIKSAMGNEEVEDEKELRNLEFSITDMKDDLITYGKHMLPVLIFFVIGILSLPGWPICCFCCCCNCCCCCCCKKPGCKIPCFIFTYLFYGLSIVICLYGITQANKIFVGLADTECSMLRFFEQVLEGETKQTTPRWPGIEGIGSIITDINGEVLNLKTGTLEALDTEIDNINKTKNEFRTKMKTSGNVFYDGDGHYIVEYSSLYNMNLGSALGENVERNLNGRYVLDLIKFFGTRVDGDEEKYTPENSVLDLWHQEYKIVSENADSSLGEAQDTFKTVADEKSGDIIEVLDEGKNTLNEIKDSFNDIKSEIEDILVNYSDLIDQYGRLGVKLVFGVLGLMNVALAVFILFICIFSGKVCTNCCCCRCIFKFFTHLLWNILAFLTFVTFMVGFIFSLVGTIGYDVMSVLSYVLSEDNLGPNGDNIIVNQLGDSKKYLDECINGNGKILDLLGIDPSQADSLNNVTSIEDEIDKAVTTFKDKLDCYTHKIYKEKLGDRLELKDESLMLIKEDADFNLPLDETFFKDHKDEFLVFDTEIDFMNKFIQASSSMGVCKNEEWKRDSVDETTCNPEGGNDGSITTTEKKTFNPLKCKPLDRDWIFGLGIGDDIREEAEILTDTMKFLHNAKTLSLANKGYSKILDDLKDYYLRYLNQYIKALEAFKGILKNITSKLRKYINKDQGFFSFIDCKFIGTNLKVMLKYLKSILGGNVKTIGLCLSIVGCSLILSISSTILLIVIINVGIDENKKKEEMEKMQEDIPEYQLNSVGRISRFKN
jgi:hypothetical protein